MATSSNGLKFMWVPGRKRHDRKGQYNTTKNYHNPYKNSNQGGSHSQRKNEAWSLGGSRGQRSIINTDAHEILGEGATGAAAATNLVGETALKVSGTAVLGSASTSAEVKLEDDAEKKLELIKENVDAANACDNQCDKTSYHNASTLVLGEKTKKNNGSDQDLDSIEQLNESKTDLNESTDNDIDVTDTASTQNLQTKHKKRRSKNRKKSKAKKEQESRPEDDKLVACLYYSLVCCDCTIS